MKKLILLTAMMKKKYFKGKIFSWHFNFAAFLNNFSILHFIFAVMPKFYILLLQHFDFTLSRFQNILIFFSPHFKIIFFMTFQVCVIRVWQVCSSPRTENKKLFSEKTFVVCLVCGKLKKCVFVAFSWIFQNCY